MKATTDTVQLLSAIDAGFKAARRLALDTNDALEPAWRKEFARLADELSTLYLGSAQLVDLAE